MVTKEQVRRWRASPERFIEEAVLMPGPDGKPSPVELWPLQKTTLAQLPKPDRLGRFPGVRVFWACHPRRTGKSCVSRWLALWQFILHPGRDCYFVSTSREHTYNLQFNELQRDMRRSPVLLELVGGEAAIRKGEVTSTVMGGRCVLLPYRHESAIGIRVDMACLSEVWSFPNTDLLDALAVGTLTTGGTCLLDSTAPVDGSQWAQLLRDPPPGFVVDYRGIEAFADTPINSDDLAALKRTMQPGEWASKIENQIVSAGLGRLFTEEQIAACQRPYPTPLPVDALRALLRTELEADDAPGWTVHIGVDRSLGGVDSDNTVVSTLVVAYHHGRRLAVLVDQQSVDGANMDAILEPIMESVNTYGHGIVHLEQYSTIDVQHELQKRGVHAGLVAATQKAQSISFPRLYSAIVSGELIFSTEHTELEHELLDFGHDPIKNRYGGLSKHRAGGHSDDAVYSLVWPLSAAFEHPVGGGTWESGPRDWRSIEEMPEPAWLERAVAMGTSLEW